MSIYFSKIFKSTLASIIIEYHATGKNWQVSINKKAVFFNPYVKSASTCSVLHCHTTDRVPILEPSALSSVKQLLS